MDLFWNEENTNLLIENLREKEHIYNHTHPNYKIQNVIKECGILGSMFKPPKSSKEILVKIASIKNDLNKTKKLIEEQTTQLAISPLFKKCQFIYVSLYGQPPAEILKRKIKIKENSEQCYKRSKKRKLIKLSQNNTIEELSGSISKQNYFKEERRKYEENLHAESDKESDEDFVQPAEDFNKDRINVSKSSKKTSDLPKGELLPFIINFIRDKPFIWDSEHPSYHNANHKRKILEDFAKSLKPPVPVNLIQYRIDYLKKKFCKELKEEASTWHLFNDCKFFLKSKNKNKEKQKNIEEEDNNAIMFKIIQFIKDKPYLYNSNHPKYYDYQYKKNILSEFAQSMNPPLSVLHLRFRLDYLKKTFFKCLKKTDGSPPWRWFKECKFFLGGNDKSSRNIENGVKKSEWPFNVNIEKFVQFLQLEPILYDISKKDFLNLRKKFEICSNYGKILFPPISAKEVAKHIKFIRKKILHSLSMEKKKWAYFDKFKFTYAAFKNVKMLNFNDLDFTDVIEDVIENITDDVKEFTTLNDIETLTKKDAIESKFEVIENEIFILEGKNKINIHSNTSAKEIGIQCNLYEELFERKIENILLKDCPCFEEVLKIIDSFKPVDKNLEIIENVTENFSNSGDFLKSDKCNVVDYKNVCHEEFQDSENEKLIDENFNYWQELEEYSSDFSDYGLTEIPFPEKIKISPKKVTDKITDSYKCDICLKTFNRSYFFEKHFTNFHSQRSLLCSICGKINSSFRKMQMHENNCNPDENRFCYECNKVFKSKIIFHDHLNCVHDRKNPYICVCGRSFMKYTKFVLHLNKYHCGALDSCKLPDYISKEFLRTFIELKEGDCVNADTIEGKLKFWCRICKTNYYNNRAYMAHFEKEFHVNAEKLWIDEFNIEGPFECEFCNHNKSVFKNISELVKHRNRHHHRRTLAEYFEKFEYTSDVHILLAEPTDYSNINSACYICKDTFSMSNYEKHFKNHEHINLEKKWLERCNIKELICNVCSQKYKDLSEFLIHRKSEHDEWPTNSLLKNIEGETDKTMPDYFVDRMNSKLIYKCSICNFYCFLKRTYIDHMLIHLPEKYIQCSCGEKFITCGKLGFHRKRNGCSKDGCLVPRFILESSSTINSDLISSKFGVDKQ